MWEFDDAQLEADWVVEDPRLRYLAGVGARIRQEASQVDLPVGLDFQPRGIVAVGKESRLIRAVLEPISKVPFVAWPFSGLPAWVGPLDLVVILASHGEDSLLSTYVEARRRGALVLIAAEEDSELALQAVSSPSLLIQTRSQDPLAAAIVVLAELHRMGLSPEVNPEGAAAAADQVAEASSPYQSLASNPAKTIALSLADAEPLIWGGSVLAGRASRRVAEAVRRNSARAALAADATELLFLIECTQPKDLFADPFDEPLQSNALIILDDGDDSEKVVSERQRLIQAAESRSVRTCLLSCDDLESKSSVDRYVYLLQQGLYAAAYLAIGLGRD